LVETFSVLVASLDSSSFTTGIHEHAVPAWSCGAAHGVAAPLRVLHHAEAEARCGPGDVGDMSHGADHGTEPFWRLGALSVTGWVGATSSGRAGGDATGIFARSCHGPNPSHERQHSTLKANVATWLAAARHTDALGPGASSTRDDPLVPCP
jgi:hypothetical protein